MSRIRVADRGADRVGRTGRAGRGARYVLCVVTLTATAMLGPSLAPIPAPIPMGAVSAQDWTELRRQMVDEQPSVDILSACDVEHAQ